MARSVCLLLFVLLVGCHLTGGQRVGVVRFDARGVSGTIRFSEVAENTIRIQANVEGLRGNHVWHIHDLPVDQTVNPNRQCMGDYVSGHYDPLNRNDGSDGYAARCEANPMDCEAGDLSGKFGPLRPNTPVDVNDTTGSFTLRGRYSILGRSVVIHDHRDASNFECGTIRSATELQGGPVTLLQSSLINPVAGTVYFKQVQGEDVQIWGKFYWIDDTAETMQHNWHVHLQAPGEEYRSGVCDITETGNIMGHYDPFMSGPTNRDGYSTECTPDTPSGCEVGDLTGKHAQLTVAATPLPYSANAFFYTDSFLNLTGEYTVNNRSVAVHVPNSGTPVVSCAPLVMSENIVLNQYRVREITLSQASPFEDTVITSTGSRRNTTLEGTAFNSLILNCSDSTEISQFSPYDLVDIPEPGVITPDRYRLGNLQTRYSEVGSATTQRLFDVPVYGADVSISSLTLRAEDGDSTTCSALIPPLMESNVIVAKVSFSRVLRGAVYLVQRDFDFAQYGNTHIIVDAYYADSDTRPTEGHNWHVHMNPSPSSNTMCSPAVGGHYNPYNVSLNNAPDSTNSNYSTDCTPNSQLRCESGDLTGKHGQLDFAPDGANRPTYTYVDSNVQLTGLFTIIGRSIAMHDIIDGLPIFDCGTVERVYVSSEGVTIRTNPSSDLRTSLTSALADEIEGLDPTDILVMNQEVVTIEFGFRCVDVSVRVLGSTPAQADTYAEMLSERAEDMFVCDGSSTGVMLRATFFPLLLVAALLYFVM